MGALIAVVGVAAVLAWQQARTDTPTGPLVVRRASIDEPLTDERAVVRMIVDNRKGPADRLVSARADVAERATLHESMEDGLGRATMEERGGIVIPERSQVFFVAGSLHVMLEDLRQPLRVGDEVQLVLEFERAGAVSVTAVVAPVPVN